MDDFPTVATLIATLQTYPADAPVRIDSIDPTSWVELQVMTEYGPEVVWQGDDAAPRPYNPIGDLS